MLQVIHAHMHGYIISADISAVLVISNMTKEDLTCWQRLRKGAQVTGKGTRFPARRSQGHFNLGRAGGCGADDDAYASPYAPDMSRSVESGTQAGQRAEALRQLHILQHQEQQQQQQPDLHLDLAGPGQGSKQEAGGCQVSTVQQEHARTLKPSLLQTISSLDSFNSGTEVSRSLADQQRSSQPQRHCPKLPDERRERQEVML
jgi:hypothetical protein